MATKSNDEEDKSVESKKAKLAEIKAAKLRNAEERKKSLKMEELRREMKLGDFNMKRNERQWREMMIEIKMPILRKELEITWHTFDRSMDIKDYSVSLMLDALDAAEEQYQINLRAHVESIDRLIRIFQTRLREHEDHYRNNLRELLSIAENETELINDTENESEALLQSTIFTMRQRIDESLSNAESNTIAKVNSLHEDNGNKRRMNAAIIEKRLTVHWHELRGVLNEYENETKERRRAYEIIKAKDERERNVIAQQVLTTSFLFESIRKLKHKIGQLRDSSNERITEIMIEHKFFHKSYWTIKQRFLGEQKEDKTRLLALTKEYNLTLTHLKNLIEKGKKLLLIMHNCGKYETQDEKIIPFTEPVEIEELRQRKKQLANLPNTCPQVLEELEVKLELFWRRTGVATIITRELQRERNRLKNESQYLRQCLRHCLSQRCIDVSFNDEEMLNELKKRSTTVHSYDASLSSFASR